MPLDIEMSNSDSSVADAEVFLNPAIAATVTPAPERVINRSREYIRHPSVRATEAPSVIWRAGEEYQRNNKKFWRCGICKKSKLLAIENGMSSALRHLKKDHNIDKKGRRIQKRIRTIEEAMTVGARVAS
jgi:hypothetical protein